MGDKGDNLSVPETRGREGDEEKDDKMVRKGGRGSGAGKSSNVQMSVPHIYFIVVANAKK
jgi:hypothetical protein